MKKVKVEKTYGLCFCIGKNYYEELKHKKYDVDVEIEVGNLRRELTFKEFENFLLSKVTPKVVSVDNTNWKEFRIKGKTVVADGNQGMRRGE